MAELSEPSPVSCEPLIVAKLDNLQNFNRGWGMVRVFGSGLDAEKKDGKGALLPASSVLPCSPKRLKMLLEGRGYHRQAGDRHSPMIWSERASHVAIGSHADVCLGTGDAALCNPVLRYDDRNIQVVAIGRGSHGGADNVLVYTVHPSPRSASGRAQVQVRRFELRGVDYGWLD